MSDPRAFGAYNWALLSLEILFSTVTLAVTGAAAQHMVFELGMATIPGKLHYNLVLAGLTPLLLTTFAAFERFNPEWWYHWEARYVHLLRILFICSLELLWCLAAAWSFYECSDLCPAAGLDVDRIKFPTLDCNCSRPILNAGVLRTIESKTELYEATQLFDLMLIFLFIASAKILSVQATPNKDDQDLLTRIMGRR